MNCKYGEYYFLDQDGDCHWYIIPLDKSEEWSDWCNLDDDDQEKWTVPKFAIEVGGSPTRVIFKEWSFGQH